MSLDRKQKAQYLKAIAEGQGRLEAAQTLALDFQAVLEMAEEDKTFEAAVDLLEGAAVEDALFAAASSGNIAAIEHYFRRRHAIREPSGPASPGAPDRLATGAQAEVRRLAKNLRPLLPAQD